MVKKILIGLLLILLVMQLLQPVKNQSASFSESDISKAYPIPVMVHDVLVKKCYDCHSNNTNYPWYVHIQPVGWWMASHIDDGKHHLDFSQFKNYTEKRAAHKLEEISEEIKEGHMPLESYLWLHPDTKVTPEESKAINDWIASLGMIQK